jgi:biotin transporter BioY
MNAKLLSCALAAVVLVIAVWPRIEVNVGAFPVAFPTGALILAALMAVNTGVLLMVLRAVLRHRSSPYPRPVWAVAR